MREWAASYDHEPGVPSDPSARARIAIQYGLFAFVAIVLAGVRVVTLQMRGITASRVLYDRLIGAVVGAQMRFFDVTESGAILVRQFAQTDQLTAQNRLSRDLNAVDQDMAPRLTFLATELLWLLGIVFAVALLLPSFLIAAVLLGALFVFISDLYLSTSRELKRHESVTRSPIYSLIGECTAGVATLRAYADAPRFFKVRVSSSTWTDSRRPSPWRRIRTRRRSGLCGRPIGGSA